MAAPTTTNEVTVRRLSEVLVGSDGNGGIKKAVDDKIAAAINALDVSSVGGAGKYISAISETDGKISATATSMDTTPTASSTNAVTSGGIKTALDGKASSTHAHGWVASDGKLTNTPFAIENGDRLVIADNSDGSKVSRTTIQFDASTTSQVLTKKGTFESVSGLITDRYKIYSTTKTNAPLPNYSEQTYYKLYQTEFPDFCTWVLLYDVTEFFNGTISQVSENSSFYGEVSSIRTAGLPGMGYAKVAASISYNTSTVLQSDSDSCMPAIAKCDVEYIQSWSSTSDKGIYIGDVGSTVDTSALVSSPTTKYCVINCSGYTTFHVNAGWYSGSWSTPQSKVGAVWAFLDSSNKVISKSSSYGASTTLTIPSGAAKFVCNTSSSQAASAYIGVPSSSSRYYLALDVRIGAGTLDLFGRFYTRTTATSSYAARPLLLTTVSNVGQNSASEAPAGWSQYRRGTHTLNANTADKFYTARKLAVSLSNTSTDTTFDGSADVTNIKVSGTLPVANGGTGQTSLANVTVGTATTASAVSHNGPGTANVSRHIWFSDSATETKRVYNDNFCYNPVGNIVTANISGNAATATSATSATSATNVNLSGDVKTTSTTNGDTIRVKAGSGTAAEITIINAKHAASADSATSATTATDYNTSTGTIKSALDGKASSSHTHGNITNAGTITADTAIANGTKIATVGTDNKVSRSPISFDGSTTTKALTPKGTFEAFAKSGDITSAINALDVSSVGGDGKYISAISETDGKISATATSMDTAPTASSTNAVTSGGIKTALDAKNDRITWTAITKGQTWSRIFKATPTIHTVGCSGILTIAATRGSVVYNTSFFITTSHAGGAAANAIELSSCNYTGIRIRLVVNSTGDGEYYFEIYDTARSIEVGTTQTWNCRYIPVLEATVTTYTAFTDGTTIPSGYSAVNDFTTTTGSSAAAIKNITRSGTTFTATRQDGSTFTFTQQDSNTDTLVKATAKTDNANYKILATASASPTSGNATEAVYDTDITLNPSTNTISASISGNAATATSAGKLTTARKTYVTLGTASTTTTRDWSGDTTIPVSGTLAVANGGTGASDASGARTNLSVYSKSEVDSMLGGRIEIVASLPSTGSPGVIYYVGPTGSGGDQYDEYIWSGSAFIKVGEHSIDLSNYVNTLTAAGSGSVVTGLSKSGNTLTWTKGNISLDNLSTWASTSDVTISSTSYHTYWPTAPTSSNQVYGVSITGGKLYQIYNNKGTYSARSYDQDTNNTYTNETMGQGYGTCTTAEATAAKAAALTDYALVKGGIVAVKFTNGLCASATLNVNGKGAKSIFIHGAAATATTAKEVLAGDIAYFMYDGTQYQFLGSDRVFKNAVTGLSISGRTITYTKADGSTGTLTTQDTTYEFDGTYSSSNKAATVSTVTSKINALDVSDISGFGAGKTLATLTETDGKIAATFQNISITKSQVSDFPTSMTPTSHSHGNITNDGKISSDTAIANGTKLATVGTDNKVARSPITFNGSTTTTALTPKGTFESFAKQADIDTAIGNIPSLNLVGNNHVTVSSDSTTGTVTIATDIGAQTAYSAKGTATKVPQITTNALGQVTGITEVTISGVTPASHAHGNIQNGGTLQATDVAIASGDKLVVTDASDSNKVARASVSFDGSTTTKALTQKGTFESFAKAADITAAIQLLDVTAVGGAGKYISAISETDGKIAATVTSMDTAPTASSTNAVTSGGVKTALDGKAPTSHASSATTYGVGTTANYGHVKLATGDMNGATHADGVAVSKNHTHSQYQTVLTEMTETEVDNLLAVLT